MIHISYHFFIPCHRLQHWSIHWLKGLASNLCDLSSFTLDFHTYYLIVDPTALAMFLLKNSVEPFMIQLWPINFVALFFIQGQFHGFSRPSWELQGKVGFVVFGGWGTKKTIGDSGNQPFPRIYAEYFMEDFTESGCTVLFNQQGWRIPMDSRKTWRSSHLLFDFWFDETWASSAIKMPKPS